MTNLFFILLVCAAVLFLERPVHAYVDPGSGSMFIQVLLGGVAGIGVIVKLYWRSIAGWLSRRSARDIDEQPERR